MFHNMIHYSCINDSGGEVEQLVSVVLCKTFTDGWQLPVTTIKRLLIDMTLQGF